MVVVWKAAAEHNNLTVQQLGAVEMVALNQFICGLNSSEFKQLNLDAFKFVPHTVLLPISISADLATKLKANAHPLKKTSISHNFTTLDSADK